MAVCACTRVYVHVCMYTCVYLHVPISAVLDAPQNQAHSPNQLCECPRSTDILTDSYAEARARHCENDGDRTGSVLVPVGFQCHFICFSFMAGDRVVAEAQQ